jgi:hypothetical protein
VQVTDWYSLRTSLTDTEKKTKVLRREQALDKAISMLFGMEDGGENALQGFKSLTNVYCPLAYNTVSLN